MTRLQGDPEHPVTRGFLCYRTQKFLSTQYSLQRLTSPLLRRGGELRPVSWDEALDFAAERLLTIRKESGPAAILHYRSGGSLGLLKCLSDYFFQLFGPTATKRGDICSGAGDAAQLLDFGLNDSSDLFELYCSRHILLWGKNAFVCSPHTFAVLRQARGRGARLVLIDPVHHRTASACEAHYQPRPGGDFALAMAVARVLFERGWTSPEAEGYCEHLEDFRRLAFARGVEEWCREADLPRAAAEDLARRLGPEKPAAILVGWGMARRTYGGAIVRALDALGAITGNLGLSGGGVSFYFRRRSAFDLSFLGGAKPPRTIDEVSFGRDLLLAEPPVRAVWVTCGNPVAMLPESERVAQALRARALVVVVDSFLTDTARCASLVLPTTTLLEADDLLGAYGHHYLGASRPAVPPPEGVKSDLEIIQALASRVGLGEAMAGSAREWKRRLIEPLSRHGVSLEDLERGPVRNPAAPKVLFAGRKFPTPSGKVRLLTEAPPRQPESEPDFPLWLMALSTEESQSSQWAEPAEGPAPVTVHPDSSSGLADGELAVLESALGALEVVVRHDARQRRDVALIPKGGHLSGGRCANALVRAAATDLGEGGALYEERVRLVPGRLSPRR